MNARPLLYLGILGAFALCATNSPGQGVVIAGSSSAQFIELRPLALDSVPLAQTDSAWGVYRKTADGILARCGTTPYCTFFRSGGSATLVAVLQDGDHFGEIALLRKAPRVATVTTEVPTLLLSLAQAHFLDVLERAPDIRRALEEIVEGRLAEIHLESWGRLAP